MSPIGGSTAEAKRNFGHVHQRGLLFIRCPVIILQFPQADMPAAMNGANPECAEKVGPHREMRQCRQ
jgi:hypothetical protein